MKKLLFIALVALTACSPLDDYVLESEFSEKMRKIEKMHGDDYTEQDFKLAKETVFKAERLNSTLMVEDFTYRELLDNAKIYREGYEREISAFNSALDKWNKARESYELTVEKIHDKGSYIALNIRVLNTSESRIEKLGLKISKDGDSATSQIYEIMPNSSLIYTVQVDVHHFDYKNRYELTMPMLYHLDITCYKGPHAPDGMFPPVKPEDPFEGYL